MEIQLTSDVVFDRPFCTQSLLLGSLANRAISLLAILSIVRVPIFANLFSRVNSWNADTIFKRVLGFGDAFKVLRINARTVLTGVVDDHILRNVTKGNEPRKTMRAAVLPLKPKSSVAVFIERALPYMAITNRSPFSVKSINLFHAVYGIKGNHGGAI